MTMYQNQLSKVTKENEKVICRASRNSDRVRYTIDVGPRSQRGFFNSLIILTFVRLGEPKIFVKNV